MTGSQFHASLTCGMDGVFYRYVLPCLYFLDSFADLLESFSGLFHQRPYPIADGFRVLGRAHEGNLGRESADIGVEAEKMRGETGGYPVKSRVV